MLYKSIAFRLCARFYSSVLSYSNLNHSDSDFTWISYIKVPVPSQKKHAYIILTPLNPTFI